MSHDHSHAHAHHVHHHHAAGGAGAASTATATTTSSATAASEAKVLRGARTAPPSNPDALFLFDVDGTLPAPRLGVGQEMVNFLYALRDKAWVAVVGGSDQHKILEQLGDEGMDCAPLCACASLPIASIPSAAHHSFRVVRLVSIDRHCHVCAHMDVMWIWMWLRTYSGDVL